MTVYHYGISIDISDNTTDTDADIGLQSGVFYWVTGRPGYTGGGYSGDAPSGQTWTEGIITDQKRLGSPVRMIDITTAGNYGSLSGFNFSIDNTSKFWDTLETNDYYLINRAVNLYVFIDDVSYQIWGGVVSEVKYNEVEYKFICDDIFRLVHKPIPPEKINDTKFPYVIEKAVGETIPVSIGNVNKAVLQPVYSSSDPIVLAVYGGEQYTAAMLASFNSGSKEITLYTSGREFSADELNGYYVKQVIGGSESIVIEDTTATVTTGGQRYYKTTLTLSSWFSSSPDSDNAIESHTDYNTSMDDVNDSGIWYFEIIQFQGTQIVSNNSITSFEPGDEGQQVVLDYWDKDKEGYIDSYEAVRLTSVSSIDNTGYPGMSLLSKSVNTEGDIEKIFAINLEDVQLIFHEDFWQYSPFFGNYLYEDLSYVTSNTFPSGDCPLLHDNDNSTSYNIVIKNILGSGEYKLDFKTKIPEQLINSSYDKSFLVIDFTLQSVNTTTLSEIDFEYYAVDYLGRETEVFTTGSDLFTNNLATGGTYYYYTIPKIHYNTTGDESQFNDIRASIDISDFLQSAKTLSAYPYIVLRLTHTNAIGVPANSMTLTVYEMAFAGQKNINTVNEDLYTKIRGEQVDSNQTNSSYRALQHIMETYDGITATDISWGTYTNTDNSIYMVGRQLNEQKKSSDYITELLKHSFTALYPTRKGKRGVSAWKNNRTPTVTHDESVIIKNSISKFSNTPISKVYNDLTVNFDWNPGLGKFNKSIFVTKVDEDSFPAMAASTGTDSEITVSTVITAGIGTQAVAGFPVDPSSWAAVGGYVSFLSDTYGWLYFGTITSVSAAGKSVSIEFVNTYSLPAATDLGSGTFYSHGSGLPEWTTFVGGVSSYATAKSWWDICHNSYERTLTKAQLPKELSDCYWFPDNENFDTGTGGAGNAAHKYMQNLVEWVPRQKDIVEYSVPLNTVNVTLEPLTPVTFSDAIYTNDADRLMWITKVKPILSRGLMVIEGILEPTDIELITLIIETGSAPDVIVEDGDGPDVYVED